MQCSENMGRWPMRFYNRFFIRLLLQRLPPQLAEQSEWAAMARDDPPRTLRELDDRFTAPLAGYADALDYYQHASAASRLRQIPIPTLVLTSEDDPIVPVASLRNAAWSETCKLAITRHGGHVGYIGGRRHPRWLEQYLVEGLLQA
jgi:predicted alpha/beta-fold hydrolase